MVSPKRMPTFWDVSVAMRCGMSGMKGLGRRLSLIHISENAQSLAEAIARVSRADTTCAHAYRQKLYVQQFVDSYRELFARL